MSMARAFMSAAYVRSAPSLLSKARSMYSRPAVTALRDTLATIAASPAGRLDVERQTVLRDDVYAVVDDLQGAGWPPERVIIAVKQIARDAGLTPSRSMSSIKAPVVGRDTVIVDIVRWCIERYYRTDARPM